MNLTPEQVQHMVTTMTPEEIKSWVQQEAYKAWKANNKRGTCEMATGTGKTVVGLIAAHAEFQFNPNAVVYIAVPTETLRDVDWPNEMDKWGYGYMKEKVRLICYKSLGQETSLEDVDLFIGDEIHHTTIANSSFFSKDHKVFGILGLTATLPTSKGGETDRDKRILIDSIAPSVFQVNIEEAIALKLVSDFTVSVLLFDLDDIDPYILAGSAKKPFHTTETKQYKYLTSQLQKAMYSQYAGMKFTAMQKRMEFIYNLRSKEYLAKEIMDKILVGNRTLIFCGSIEQSINLCGKQVYNSASTDEQLSLFCDEKIDYLGVVQALNEGKNVPNLDQALVVQINSKELGIIQRIGREIRYREGHVARIVVLVARGTVDEKWYRSAFENFNKSRIKEYHVTPEYRTINRNIPNAT